jgi:hypothetical protein
MKKHSSKAFIEYLDKIGNDLKVFEHAQKDRRLNQLEQQIINCWNLLRSNKLEKIISLTEKKTSDSLYQSQILLLRGIAEHNSGNFLESISLFKKAIQQMNSYELRRMKFVAFYNLFNAHLNLKLINELELIYQSWKQIPSITLNEKMALRRAELRMHLANKHFAEAENLISDLEKNLVSMSELNRLNFHIDLFEYFVMKNDFVSCEKILEKLKKYRSYHSGAHYKYLKKLTDFILFQKPLYIYERDYHQNKTLFNEISVLKNLEEKNYGQAEKFWNKLKINAPHLYGNEFKYLGGDCLFSIALNIIHQVNISKNQKIHLNQSNKFKEITIYELLLQHKKIEKNELYELVWNKKLETKKELSKLQSVISRFNQKSTKIQIKYRKGCYQLVNETQVAS